MKTTEMKSILLPTDFSQNARNAARYALGLFENEPALYLLLHAYQLPYRSTEIMMSSLQDNIEASARQDLEAARNLLASNGLPDHSVCEIITRFGNVDDVITQYTSENPVDYVIMGTQGATGLKGILVGSHTSAVLRKITCPLLAIPEEAQLQKPASIVLAVNPGKPLPASAVFAPLREIALSCSTQITVFSILEGDQKTDNADQRSQLQLAFDGVPVEFVSLRDKVIEAGIERFLTTHPADLLVVLPGEMTLLDRIFHRSVTRKLTLHTKVPLLSLPVK